MEGTVYLQHAALSFPCTGTTSSTASITTCTVLGPALRVTDCAKRTLTGAESVTGSTPFRSAAGQDSLAGAPAAASTAATRGVGPAKMMGDSVSGNFTATSTSPASSTTTYSFLTLRGPSPRTGLIGFCGIVLSVNGITFDAASYISGLGSRISGDTKTGERALGCMGAAASHGMYYFSGRSHDSA